ncbi:hypothetical protein BV22DRAFT_786299 [Leucogyrophana mollusca]|uniref:Uncharacterized protein n=1 Tax=Leucogyrophana mollusca TaxID=85980 RepID=A0ACB8B5I4_9AGAM|nr:hypothetical protein BV22DRAFT_786299 [Leucogyrophana mollusca]
MCMMVVFLALEPETCSHLACNRQWVLGLPCQHRIFNFSDFRRKMPEPPHLLQSFAKFQLLHKVLHSWICASKANLPKYRRTVKCSMRMYPSHRVASRRCLGVLHRIPPIWTLDPYGLVHQEVQDLQAEGWIKLVGSLVRCGTSRLGFSGLFRFTNPIASTPHLVL